MRLTWFGEKFWRVHLAGQIIVISDGSLPAGVDPREAEAGADHIFNLRGANAPQFVADRLSNAPKRLIDQFNQPQLEISAFANGAALIAFEEPPLFVAPAAEATWGRFADNAVIVLAGEDSAKQATAIFASARPKLLALAVPEISEEDFGTIAAAAGQSAVQLLEPGMALEA